MKPKIIFKITIDFLMMIALLALISYALIGETAHEWIGTGMFILFITHIVMNWRWWRNIIKGKYTLVRVIQTLINLLIFIGMIVQAVSGIMMSRHVFAFFPINGGISYARTLHLVCSYWSFALMSVHLGFHGGMLVGIAKKATHIKESSQDAWASGKRLRLRPARLCVFVLRVAALSVAAYGIYAFVQRGLGSYMLLQNQFVFFDFEEPLILFFIDYIAIVALFVCVGHYVMRGITRFSQRRKSME